MSNPKEVTDAEFENEVLKSELPVLVDYWAPWCGPCRLVAPIVEELAEEYDGRVKFVKVNTDDNVGTAVAYGIRSIPTLLLFKDGQQIDQIIGFRPKRDLQRLLEKGLAQAESSLARR
ncbi:MAG: thioredoxin [Dehalococcoidia bacterium]